MEQQAKLAKWFEERRGPAPPSAEELGHFLRTILDGWQLYELERVAPGP